MATIKPFGAIRPAVGMEEKIAALPYDVYNRQEAKEVVSKNPKSFLAIDRAETSFSDDVDTYADCVYEKASEMLWDAIANGDYITDEKPCFYLYQQTMDGRVQTGIVGCASVDDYQNNVIKKHENTREDKELDRIRHVDTCNAQTGPIFLAYRRNEVLSEVIKNWQEKAPVYDFVSDDGIGHKVWVINDAEIVDKIQEVFGTIDNIYIADGHHRCASAVKVSLKRREANKDYTGDEEFNYFLSVLFPGDELFILDYNRVLKTLNGMEKADVVAKVGDIFTLVETSDEAIKPREKGQVSMYVDGKWYLYSIPDTLLRNDPVKDLDVSMLQDYVLNPLFGILDPKTDKNIDFVGGIRGLKELERRVSLDCEVAFAMYPTSINELFSVSDAGLLMPPKSTWFEPKLRSGLFIHSIK